jgi:hypothetical protein
MLRAVSLGFAVVLCCATPVLAQADGSSLEAYFTGKQVVLKVDMPGTEKGVDLKFNKPAAMDWNDYSSRIKANGVAIHKGDVATVTKFVVKGDTIEFQLNGGGFGTAHDDTNTTVTATATPKSQYEKDLEKQLAAAADPGKKRDIQRDLDKERARREQMDARSQSDAQLASQMKAQQVAQRRLNGGSRFNLRWQGSIPSDARTPETIKQLLAEYVDFDPAAVRGAAGAVAAPIAATPPPTTAGGAPQLKRGMRLDDVTQLLGRGKTMSDTTSSDGLRTQEIVYASGDNLVDVTYVEGVVVRFSITSN